MCIMCDKNVVEDEFHFILQFTNYNDIRKKFIKKYYWTRRQLINKYNCFLLKTLGNSVI